MGQEPARGRALYRAYFQNSAEGVFMVGVRPEGDFAPEELNPAYERSTGLLTAAVRSHPLEDVLPAELTRAATTNSRQAVDAGQVQSHSEGVTMVGEITHWDTVLAPVRDASGAITRIVGGSRDMTAQVEAQAELHQVQKLEVIGQLAGGVAHD